MKLIDVYAIWCDPCKMMSPVLDRLKTEYGIEVEKVNSDDNPSFVQRHNIQGIPTLLVYDENDKEINRIVGYRPLNKLLLDLGIEKK